MEETIILTKYISAWNWQLIAIMFFCVMAIASMFKLIPYIIGFGLGVGIAQYMALKRKVAIHE